MLIQPRPSPSRKRGRHRAPLRWSLYRPHHRSEDPSIVSLLVPAWRNSATTTLRPPPPHNGHAPATAGPPEILDLDEPGAAGPSRLELIPLVTAPAPEAPPLDDVLADHAPEAVGTVEEPSEPELFDAPLGPPVPTAGEPGHEPPFLLGPIVDLRTRPEPAPPAPPVPARRIPPGGQESYLVDRSVVLPRAAAQERGTFANLLGFGEDEAYYGPPADDYADLLVESPVPPARPSRTSGLAAPPPRPAVDDWEHLPRLSDVTSPDVRDTGTLVSLLWEATADQPIIGNVDVAEPIEPNQTLLSDQRVRGSVLVALALAVIIVFGLGNAMGRRPIEEAIERTAAYQQSSSRLAVALGPIEADARLIVDPATDVLETPEVVSDLDVLDGVARDVSEIAAEPLPKPAFLGSSEEIDRLDTPRALLQRASGQAATLEQRLGDALAYRLAIGQAFQFPELPVSAGSEQVGTLGSELSVALTSTRTTLDRLPTDPFFATHTEDAYALLDELTDIHVDYLDALRQEDPARAGIVRRDMAAAIDGFDASISEPLRALATWSADQLQRLDTLLDQIDGALR